MKWGSPVIEFYTLYKEDFGAIAPPVPAAKIVPDWYRQLPAVDPSAMSTETTGQTIKACPAVFDAMADGWIVCVPADIRVELHNGEMKIGSTYPRQLATSHYNYQIRGSPDEHKQIIKFHSLWCVRTAPGYSCLFVPPLNRHSDFVVYSGIIDTDRFYQQIAPPAVLNLPDGVFTIPKGVPIVQVIPFRREKYKAVIRASKKDESDFNTQQMLGLSTTGLYRKLWRAKR